MATDRSARVELDAASHWTTRATVGPHEVLHDVLPGIGGQDEAPSPEEALLAAYGSCTAMTVSMYAQRKEWPLEKIAVNLTLTRRTPGNPDRIERTVELYGPLDAEQKKRLIDIAEKCPVHRILSGAPQLITRLEEQIHE